MSPLLPHLLYINAALQRVYLAPPDTARGGAREAKAKGYTGKPGDNVIQIDYEEREHFKPATQALAKTSTTGVVVSCVRRGGKTHWAAKSMFQRAVNETIQGAWIAPTATQAVNVGMAAILHFIRNIPGVEVRKGENLIRIPAADGGTSEIRFFAGVDDQSAGGVRGYGFDLVTIDEFAQIDAQVWDEAILPTMMGRPRSQFIAIGTPRGMDRFYHLFQEAERTEGMYAFHIPASATNLYSPQELQQIADRMGGKDTPGYMREIEASFHAPSEWDFLNQMRAREAMARIVSEHARRDLRRWNWLKLGIDTGFAESGDPSVAVARLGSALLEIVEMKGASAMEVATKILALAQKYDPDEIAIDVGAAGIAVKSICESMGLNIVGVGFGDRSDEPQTFRNKRVEMFSKIREWMGRPDCTMPQDETLLREIGAVRYHQDASNRTQIESKDAIRKRLGKGASTDRLDALACTFYTSETVVTPALADILDAPPQRRWSSSGGGSVEYAPDGSKYYSHNGVAAAQRRRARHYGTSDDPEEAAWDDYFKWHG